jgi:hypothetical protein
MIKQTYTTTLSAIRSRLERGILDRVEVALSVPSTGETGGHQFRSEVTLEDMHNWHKRHSTVKVVDKRYESTGRRAVVISANENENLARINK